MKTNFRIVEDLLKNEFFIEWVKNPNPESDHFWTNWIQRNPDKRDEVALAREIVQGITYQNPARLDNEDYAFLLDRILRNVNTTTETRRKSRPRTRYVWLVAATLSILMVLTILNKKLHVLEEHHVVDSWVHSSADFGQKKTLYLPDGTRVVLNSGSTVKYPSQFNDDSRSIQFSGEAFFDVVHQPQRPFIITTEQMTTKVLGTSFNLRAFDDEDEISVAVVTGKVVLLTDGGLSAFVLPNHKGIFNKKNQVLEKKTFDADKEIAWTDGTLIFENEELPVIFRKLEKWYGVSITVESGVKLEGRYSGEYKRKSLELVLEGISYTSNIKFKIENKTVMIY